MIELQDIQDLPSASSLVGDDVLVVVVHKDDTLYKLRQVSVSDLTTSVAGLIAGDGDVIANGAVQGHIADVGDSATGAQLATAINAIIDALEAFGMAATE